MTGFFFSSSEIVSLTETTTTKEYHNLNLHLKLLLQLIFHLIWFSTRPWVRLVAAQRQGLIDDGNEACMSSLGSYLLHLQSICR